MVAEVVQQREWGTERTELTDAFSRYASRPPLPIAPAEELRDYYIQIDSGMRDTATYPNRSSFRYELTEPLSNVYSMEILSLAIANVNSLISEPYILLDFGSSLNSWEAGVNRTRAFQIMYAAQRVNWNALETPPTTIDSNTPMGLIIMDKKSAERSPTIFRPSKPRLMDINIVLRNRYGAQLDLGSDTTSSALIANEDCQWSMSIKIQCAVPPTMQAQRFGT